MFILETLQRELVDILVYLAIYFVSSFVLVRISKNKDKKQQLYSTLVLLNTVFKIKFGSKATQLVDIWMDGLKKIQDGEFSNEDKTDQFLRFIRLAASNKGISLSNEEVEVLHTLILATFEKLTQNKPKDVTQAVNKFQSLNHA